MNAAARQKTRELLSCGWRLARRIPFVSLLWGLRLKCARTSRRRALHRHWAEVLKVVGSATADLFCYPEYGTLLGLMREHGVIAHDEDMDFGVVGVSLRELWRRLAPLGFRLVHAFEYRGEIVEIATRYRGVTVDFFLIDTSEGRPVTYAWDWIPDNSGRWPGRRLCPPAISALREMSVGSVDVRIPANWDDILVYEYGPSWRIPDPSWKGGGGERLEDRAVLRYGV